MGGVSDVVRDPSARHPPNNKHLRRRRRRRRRRRSVLNRLPERDPTASGMTTATRHATSTPIPDRRRREWATATSANFHTDPLTPRGTDPLGQRGGSPRLGEVPQHPPRSRDNDDDDAAQPARGDLARHEGLRPGQRRRTGCGNASREVFTPDGPHADVGGFQRRHRPRRDRRRHLNPAAVSTFVADDGGDALGYASAEPSFTSTATAEPDEAPDDYACTGESWSGDTPMV